MRAAPPVSVRGNGGPAWRAVQAALPALATAAVLFWALLLIGATPAPAFVALAAAAVVGALAWRMLGSHAAVLSWSGQHWTLDDAPVTPVTPIAPAASAAGGPVAVQGRLDVMMDLGTFLLLRLVPAAGRRRWMAITAREAGAHWHGLRAAAYAHPAPPATDADTARGSAADLRPPEAAR